MSLSFIFSANYSENSIYIVELRLCYYRQQKSDGKLLDYVYFLVIIAAVLQNVIIK